MFGFTKKRSKSPARTPGQDEVLDRPLLRLSDGAEWTARDACEGTQAYGGTGSGKTTGSARLISTAFLRAGYGGLVLTAKPDEAERWQKLGEETGRKIHIFRPGNGMGFNFLDYELRRSGPGGGFTENLVELLASTAELGNPKTEGKASDPFWGLSLRQLLRNAIELVVMTTGQITLQDIYRVISDAPQDLESLADGAWQKHSETWKALEELDRLISERELPPERIADAEMVLDYWTKDFPALAPKTRGIVCVMFSAAAEGLLRSPLRQMFCEETTVVPEMTHEGMVLVIDLPVLEYGHVGRVAQMIWKRVWQKATERRKVDESTLPTFLWADESQYFATADDAKFQTTARSARACTVYITQSIPNYHAAIGKAETESLMANLTTRVFHNNSCSVTNLWAADLIARGAVMKPNMSTNTSGDHRSGQFGSGASFSEQYEHQVHPIDFLTLKTGGPLNDRRVEALMFKPGKRWGAAGKNFLKMEIKQ